MAKAYVNGPPSNADLISETEEGELELVQDGTDYSTLTNSPNLSENQIEDSLPEVVQTMENPSKPAPEVFSFVHSTDGDLKD
jgi:hypothetical protein